MEVSEWGRGLEESFQVQCIYSMTNIDEELQTGTSRPEADHSGLDHVLWEHNLKLHNTQTLWALNSISNKYLSINASKADSQRFNYGRFKLTL